jgi:hypothetical protein
MTTLPTPYTSGSLLDNCNFLYINMSLDRLKLTGTQVVETLEQDTEVPVPLSLPKSNGTGKIYRRK